MNAGLLILRVASERRDAQNERDVAGLRSSVAAALQPSTQLVVFVASLLEVLLAAHRGGTRRAGGTSRGDASCAQHQLRRGRDAQNERDGAGLRSSVAQPNKKLKLFWRGKLVQIRVLGILCYSTGIYIENKRGTNQHVLLPYEYVIKRPGRKENTISI